MDPHNPPRPPAAADSSRGGYDIRPDNAWEAARRDYLDGLTGPEVCQRHGLRLGTFRHRAAVDGWRRRDQPAPEPVADDADLALFEEVEPGDLADLARSRMNRAIYAGRAGEALRWRRLCEILGAEAREIREWFEQDVLETAAFLERQRVAQAARISDDSDDSDSIFS